MVGTPAAMPKDMRRDIGSLHASPAWVTTRGHACPISACTSFASRWPRRRVRPPLSDERYLSRAWDPWAWAAPRAITHSGGPGHPWWAAANSSRIIRGPSQSHDNRRQTTNTETARETAVRRITAASCEGLHRFASRKSSVRVRSAPHRCNSHNVHSCRITPLQVLQSVIHSTGG